MSDFWIKCTADQMVDGSCKMNVYETLWPDVNPKAKDLKSFSKDAFWWITMFIWFIVFAALIYSWFLMILWWADEKQFETWKKWVIYSIIWLLLVWLAYGIVRLIQIISQW